MAQRAFTSDDQLMFAALSGDHNPLHMDPVVARRLLFGRQIVHGLHALLWGLDEWLTGRMEDIELRSLTAEFHAGIGLGQVVECICVHRHENAAELRLEIDTQPVVSLRIEAGPSQHRREGMLLGPSHDPGICRERSLDEAMKASGAVPLYLDREPAAGLFPNLMRLLPHTQVASLLATTRLVGMECPGLHSIYSGLEVKFSPDSGGAPELEYRVAQGNRRLGLLVLNVRSPGMTGHAKAFYRPSFQSQAAFTAVRREVEPNEFADQRALVVGGSRGLGEVAAKILAAGGAEVVVTYHCGEQDAARVVAEITATGGTASCVRFDALAPSIPLIPADHTSKPMHLYYFATPPIFGAAKGRFSTTRFALFSDYYVAGLLRTVLSLTGAGLTKVFYPSSQAIDELPPDMGEYAAAKRAGETLCEFLQKTLPGVAFHTPRLPRLATDQTVSLLPIGNQDPLSVLLAEIRHMRDLKPALQ